MEHASGAAACVSDAVSEVGLAGACVRCPASTPPTRSARLRRHRLRASRALLSHERAQCHAASRPPRRPHLLPCCHPGSSALPPHPRRPALPRSPTPAPPLQLPRALCLRLVAARLGRPSQMPQAAANACPGRQESRPGQRIVRGLVRGGGGDRLPTRRGRLLASGAAGQAAQARGASAAASHPPQDPPPLPHRPSMRHPPPRAAM